MNGDEHADDRCRARQKNRLHGNEEVVDRAENAIRRRTLIVMLHAHAQHVEEDAHHDEYVELLVRCQIEEESGDGELEEMNVS